MLSVVPLFLAEARTDLGEWKWADLPAGWVITLFVIVAFLWIRSLYRKEGGRAPRAGRFALAVLRTVVLLLALLLLGGPYREEERFAEEPTHLVVLVDTSGSMKNVDRYPPAEERRLLDAAYPEDGDLPRPASLEKGQVGRLALVKRVLAGKGERLLRRLAERFILHVFAFDEGWRSLGTTEPEASTSEPSRAEAAPPDPLKNLADAIRDLSPEGPRTRIGEVLRNVDRQFLNRDDRHLAGVLLITDGQDTSDGEGPVEAVAALGSAAKQLKVTAVALGNPAGDKNLRVEPIRAKDVVLVRDLVLFETALRHKGFEGARDVTARMSIERIADEKGTPVTPAPWDPPADGRSRIEAEDLVLPAEKDPLPVRLLATFDQPGTFRVSIRGDLSKDDQKDDAVLDDNVAVHELRVVDQSIRVLYVDRLPRYDWRFLSNYLTREASPDLIRSAAPGAAGRSQAEHSRFLAHVLLQTMDPTVDPPYTHGSGMKPLKSFPTTRDQLFAYDVIILGDIDRKLLGRTVQEENSILALIRDFVEEGGGLALQPGVDMKNPLDFLGTPLAELLPVAVAEEDRKYSERTDHEFRLELTDAGMRHPIFQVIPSADGESLAPEQVSAIWRGDDAISREWKWWWTYRPRGGIKPGAVDLSRAFVDDPAAREEFLDERERPVVVFAAMSFGKGRVFWSGIDDISRIRREHRDQIYGAFWEQVIRYLATYRLLGGNKRFKIFTSEEQYQVGDRAEVTVTALDPRFQPLEDRFLEGVHVELPDNRGRLDLEGDQRPESVTAEGGPPGTYRFYLPIKHTGTYLIWIEQREDVRDVGDRAEKRIKAENRAREDALRTPNHEVLAQVAEATGGRVVSLADLETLSIPSDTIKRVLDRTPRQQWDKAWVLLLMTFLLGLEWALRKRWQMI